jgi:hypothetical protein
MLKVKFERSERSNVGRENSSMYKGPEVLVFSAPGTALGLLNE